MTEIKISELHAATQANATDQIETNQSGVSRRLTVAQIATHTRSAATDAVVVAVGSATAPSIAPTGDSNTGVFFPAADTIAFAEGGVEAMRIDASANVGIGTSAAGAARLVVTSPANSPSLLLTDATQSTLTIKHEAGNLLTYEVLGGAVHRWVGNNAERLRIASAGQIGIGGANFGTSGQVLTSNGAAAAPSWQTVSASGRLLNVQVFTSSGTYTRTSGATRAVVIAVGGGGGGGGSNGANAVGNGSNGGTTSFGAHVTAVGGGGAIAFRGGAGGTGGTGATIAIPGAPGAQSAGQNGMSLWSGAPGGGQGGGQGVAGATTSGSGTAGVAGVRGGGGGGAVFVATAGCCGPISNGGGGGGQGETAIDYIASGLNATETVTIGAGGSGGPGGRSGGNGGAGYVIVYEYS